MKLLLACYGGRSVVKRGPVIDQLKTILAKISDPSFTKNSLPLVVQLSLDAVPITRNIMDILLRILNFDFANNRNTTPTEDTGSGSEIGKKFKWDFVSFSYCRLELPGMAAASRHNQEYCTSDQIVCLTSALAKRTRSLSLSRSCTILDILLDIPLEMGKFRLDPPRELSNVLATRLGNMIQRSVALTSLSLSMPLHHIPTELIDSLQSTTHLQELNVRDVYGLYQPLPDEWFARVLCDRLLVHHHPQSQLRRLSLHRLKLEDSHFITLAQLLPGTQIEYLDVTKNNIGIPGIFELARQLPMIHCLKEVVLFENPWKEKFPYRYDEGAAALAQGMVHNYSMEKMRTRDCNVLAFGTPDDMVLAHFTTLNRAGRKILSNLSVPIGLWPLIFERMGRTLPSPWGANALYFFLNSSSSAILSGRLHQYSKVPLSRKTKRKYGVSDATN